MLVFALPDPFLLNSAAAVNSLPELIWRPQRP